MNSSEIVDRLMTELSAEARQRLGVAAEPWLSALGLIVGEGAILRASLEAVLATRMEANGIRFVDHLKDEGSR